MKTDIIYNEDCLLGLKKILNKTVDLVIIDPPYLIDIHKSKIYNKITKQLENLKTELKKDNLVNGYNMEILEEIVRVMKKINIYIWCNGKQIPMYLDFFVKKYKCSFDILLWNKTNAMPLFNNKYLSDKEYCLYFRKNAYCQPTCYEDAKTVFYYPINIIDKRKWKHPTIKPVNIIRTLIRNSSKENDIVLDCFMGSGTTAVASLLENRKYIGFEINKEYYDISKDRVNQLKTKDRIL